MLKLDHISYWYRKGMQAITDATAEIGPGVYLLLGENGAGKTTLLHIIAGLLSAREGACTLDGVDVSKRLPSTLGNIFFLPDDFACPFSTIEAMAHRHGSCYSNFSPAMMYANLQDFGLTGKEKISSLSLGMRHKAYVAYALALGVDYLLLDEPTNGMDIDSKKALKRIINRCVGDEQTLIISTHYVHDLGSLFDHLMLMRLGRLRIAMPIWKILERIAFVSSPSPLDNAIYQEPDMGRFKAIVPNEEHIDTDIDYPLFYSAVMTPVGDSLIDFLNSDIPLP